MIGIDGMKELGNAILQAKLLKMIIYYDMYMYVSVGVYMRICACVCALGARCTHRYTDIYKCC